MCNVYVIASEVGLSKIGISHNVKERLQDIKNMSPVPITLFKSLKVAGEHMAHLIELQCHEELKDLRDHGEWFRIDPQAAWDKVVSVSKSSVSVGPAILSGSYFKRRAAALKAVRGKETDKSRDSFVEKIKSLPCNTRISAMRCNRG